MIMSLPNSRACIARAVLDLEAAVQSYAWGKYGLSSKVAQLAEGYHSVDEAKPYAEVWSIA